MIFTWFKRRSRRRLVVEFNPFQILVAEIIQPHRGAVVLHAAAELDRDDEDGLRRWIENSGEGRREWLNAICGVVPRRGMVRRESLQVRNLAKTSYLAELIENQQKHRVLSASPFKVTEMGAWTVRAVSAIDGTTLPADANVRTALIFGMATDEVAKVQQRLLDLRLMPDRIEPGLLSLFGVVYRNMERRGDTRAVVLIVIHPTTTAVYILGKEGVHTPSPVFHGFSSIMDLARKEFGLKEDEEVLRRLKNPDQALLSHAAKLVRPIGRELKPVVDSYEMTTGQPVDEILCAYLPANLAWISEPLVRATGRSPMAIDCGEWLPTAGLQVSANCPVFGPHWLGALSLVADLPEVSRVKSDRVAGEDPAYHRPWHVDCRLAAELEDHKLAGLRLLTGSFAGALAAFVLFVASWQLYANHSLRKDILNWERQKVENRKLFQELAAANADLKALAARIARAHELTGASFQLSELILNLGRTIPARMRVDRIETSDDHVILGGHLLEPAEEASATAGRYMDDLRRNPAIGPLFSSIAITSLQRKETSDSVIFEITLRLNRPEP